MASSGPASAAPAALITATKNAEVVEVPARLVLTLSGEGSPSSPEFEASIAALYGIAYGLKFRRKKGGGQDFKVGPLVGIWWAVEAPTEPGQVPPENAWRWAVQLDVPADVTHGDVQETIGEAVAKRGGKLEGNQYAKRVALVLEPARRFGRILHLGSYADEPASFETIGARLKSEGLVREPWHIEVYLSDPGRVPADKLKTVLLAPLSE